MDQDPREWVDDRLERATGVYDDHGRIFHVIWIVVGFVIVAAGLAMTVFPGPATVVVPFGLVMLAVVFGWARRLLLRSVDVGDAATSRFRRASTPVKTLTVAAAVCAVGGVAAWFVL